MLLRFIKDGGEIVPKVEYLKTLSFICLLLFLMISLELYQEPNFIKRSGVKSLTHIFKL